MDEIIEQYLAGEFEGEDLEQVRNHFFKSDARKEKLRLAIALEERKSRSAANGSTPVVTQLQPRRWSIPPYLAVAAMLLVTAGVSTIVWRAFYSHSDLDDGLVALNAAYREQRPVEARLSNLDYAPLPTQRSGGEAKVNYVQQELAARLLAKAVTDKPSSASHNALGQYYLADRQFDKAIDQFNLALTLDPNDARSHLNLGAALLEKGNVDSRTPEGGKALAELSKSLEHLNKGLELNSGALEGYFNRALAYQSMMLTREAEAAWKEYLQKDPSSPWANEARGYLKVLEENKKRSSRNIDEILNQFRAARAASNADAAWKLVSEHYTSGGNELSNRLLDSFLGLSADDAAVSTALLSDLSYIAEMEKKRTGDRFTSDLVSQYGRAGPETRSRLSSARQRANTAYSLFTQTLFTDALNEYIAAEEEYQKAGDSIGRTFMLYRLAHCYVLLSDPEKARQLFQQLFSICEAKSYRWLAIQSLYGLAHATGNSIGYSKAIDYSREALTRSERYGDRSSVVKALTQLASHTQEMYRGDTALDYLSRALTIASEEHIDPFQRWGVFNQLGFSMAAKQLYAAALLYQQQALDIALEMERPLIVARSHGYVGSAYAALQKYPEAVSEASKGYEAGAGMSGTREGRETMAIASWVLGDVLREAGQCDKAVEAYDRCINLSSELKYEYFSYSAHKGKLFCFSSSGNDQAMGNEIATLLRLVEVYRSKITRESERNSFFAEEQSVYDLAIDYEFGRKSNPVKAFEYSETSRARTLLAAVSGSTSVQQMPYGLDLEITPGGKPLSLSEIRAQMRADAQILQYSVVDNRVFIWVVNKSGIQHEVVNLDASSLTGKVRSYLAVVNRPPAGAGDNTSTAAREMFQLLIAPVERFLDKNKFLCVVPDKILHYVPFDALVSPSTGTYLVEDYTLGIGTAPSSTVFVDRTNAAAAKTTRKVEESFLGVANPSFDRVAFNSLQDLKAAVTEVKRVSEFYPRRHHPLLIGPQATKSNIKAEIEKADVVHLAMHYILNGKSEMLSGFPLTPSGITSQNADGFLPFAEIYSLKLPRTRLALLSACQTGIEQQYDAEGAVGAARPFLVAGVPVVVASLWPVDSDATAQLMIDLHKQRTRDERPVTQALREAKLEMLRGQDQRYRHPYYWAPFVVVGGLSTF